MGEQVRVDVTVLCKRVESLTAKHGNLRKAADATGVSFTYLCRLQNGVKVNPSADTLHKLGLTKIVSFERTPE